MVTAYTISVFFFASYGAHRDLHSFPTRRSSDLEYDVVVASGEQVTSGLLAITLQGMGLNARSYMGSQLPIRASGHASALIDDIDAGVLERVFAGGGIAVIDRKSTRLNSSHGYIAYAVFCLKKK